MALLVLTVAEKQAKLQSGLYLRAELMLGNLASNLNNDYNSIWNNSDGLTPQQSWDSFGTRAVQMHHLWLAAVNFVNTIKPGNITLTEPALVENQDGTITVS